MVKNVCKRTLSSLLAILMIVTTFCFADLGLTASAKLEKATGGVPAITFYVPETVYLKPVASAVNTSQTFQYFLDCDSSGNITPGYSTTGRIYFNCAGATSVSITASGASISLASGSLSGTSSVTAAISQSSYPSSAVTIAGHSQITWTVTYVKDGITYTTKAYTNMYAPYIGSVAAAAETRTSKYNSYAVSSVSVIWGIHALKENVSQGFNLYYGTSSYTTNGPNDNYPAVFGGGYNPHPILKPLEAVKWTGDGQFARYSSAAGFTGMSSVYRKSSSSSDFRAVSGVGLLYVDTSRVSNLSHIPNFNIGGHWDDGDRDNKGEDYYLEVATKQVYCRQSGDLVGATRFIDQSDTRTDPNVYTSTINNLKTVQISASTKSIMTLAYTNYRKDNGKTWAYSGVDVETVDKTALRTGVHNEAKLGRQQVLYTSTTWSAYETKLKDAYTILGQVDATSTQIANALSGLTAAANALKYETGTASVTHKSARNTSTVFGTDTLTYNRGDTVTSSANSYTGYTFKNQQRGTNAASASSSDTVKYVTSASISWTYYYDPNKYTVTYNPNGGSFAIASNTVYYDDAYTIGAEKGNPTYAGHTFTGWLCSADGKVYTSSNYAIATWKWASNVTFTAQWTPYTYTIKYDSNGGTGTTDTVSSNFDATLTTKGAGTFQKAGHTLSGWSTSSGTAANVVAPGNNIAVKTIATAQGNGGVVANGGTLTLYAVWTINQYRLSVNPNGGTMAANSVTYTKSGASQKNPSAFSGVQEFYVDYNTEVSLASPTRTGYKFTFWTATNTTSITQGNPAKVVVAANNGSLEANWQALPITVKFNSNGGSGNMANQVINYDATQKLSANTFTRAGYTFAGWAKSSTGAVELANAASVKGSDLSANPAQDGSTVVTLYAKWNPKKLTVTYNYGENEGQSVTSENGLSVNDDKGNRIATYDVKVGDPIPMSKSDVEGVKEGWEFVGWNTDKKAHVGLDTMTMPADDSGVTLYAIYKKELTASFYDYTHQTETESVKETVTIWNDATSGSITTPTIMDQTIGGESFTGRGWSTTATSSGKADVEANTATTIYGGEVYYASYKATVTATFYYYNGSEQTSATSTGTRYCNYKGENVVDTSVAIPDAVTHSEGDVGTAYKGISTAANSTTATTSPTTATKTYYAFYTVDITFYYSDGTALTSSNLTRGWISDGSKYVAQMSGNAPQPGDYNGAKFLRWSTSQDSYPADGPVISADSSTAFYAVYEKTVWIKYDFSEGTDNGIKDTDGTMHYIVISASAASTFSVDVSVTETIPAKAGYDFQGWAEISGGAKKYSGGETITLTADKTIYAVWKPHVYTITYMDKGNVAFSGRLEDGTPQTHTFGTDTTLKSATKTGYTFVGWFTDDACTSTNKVTVLGGKAYTADITLYALWTTDTFKIHYNANTKDASVKGIPADGTAYYGQDFKTSATAPTRTGYTFAGWNVNQLATSGTAAGGTFSSDVVNGWYAEVKKDGTYNLYATWSIVNYTITYNVNAGGTGSSTPTAVSSTETYTIENSQNVTIATTSATGYTLNHWAVTSTDNSANNWKKTYTAGEQLTERMYGNVTLTAQWTANTYVIVFNGNNNTTGAMPVQDMTYDRKAKLSTNNFERIGYIFDGWSETANGNVKYEDGAEVINLAPSGQVTLFAHWVPVQYTLTYKLDGGELRGENIYPATSGSYVHTDNIVIGWAERTGYTFMGWLPSKTEGSAYTAYNWDTKKLGKNGATTTIGTNKQGDVTLTAQWQANNYTLTFDVNKPATALNTPYFKFVGATTTDDPTQKYILFDSECGADDGVGKTWPTISLNGYKFLGWFDDRENGTEYTSSTQYKVAGDTTLYAHWEVIYYDLAITATAGGKVSGTYGSTEIAVNGTTSASDTQTYSVATDTAIELSVTPYTGYKFDNWTMDGISTANAFTMPANNVTLVANFSKALYKLTVTLGKGAESASANYKNSLNQDAAVTDKDTAGVNITFETALTMAATAKPGYRFSKWTIVKGSVDFTDSTTALTEAAKFNMPAEEVTIRADFETVTYTITFNNNDSTGSTKATNTTESVDYNVENAIELPSNSRVGYRFDGWKPRVAPGNWGTDNLTGTVEAGKYNNITLDAQWTAHTYSVTVDTAGGSTAPTVATQRFDGAAFSVAAPTKTGYTFAGWKLGGTNPDYTFAKYGTSDATENSIAQDTVCTGSIVYFKNLTAVADGSVTLTAQWTANETTIELDSKVYIGDSSKPATVAGTTSVKATYDSAMHAITVPTMTGYTFHGYYDAKAGAGTKYYNADGYSAANWNKDVATATLYAYWTANEYVVTLDSKLYKGETSKPATTAGTASVTVTFDAAMPAITTPTMTGYTFGGYYTGKGGTGTKYYNADGSSANNWDIANDTTLYALWTVNNYTITYKDQGDKELTADNADTLPKMFAYDTGITLVAGTRKGYTFDGWFAESDCTGTAVTKIDGDATAKNVTLYAKWTLCYYTVTYDLNGGEIAGTPYPADGGNYTVYTQLQIAFATRTGHTFVGWTPSRTEGSAYEAYNWGNDIFGNTTSITTVDAGKIGDVTFKANWAANTFDVVFNANAGDETVTDMPETVTGHAYGTEFAIPETAPFRSGWEFAGWTTKADGSGDVYAAGTTVSAANVNGWYALAGGAGKTMNLYAKWIREAFTLKVVLGTGGASASAGTVTNTDVNGKNVTYGDNMMLAQTPAEGYHFTGWTATGIELDENAESFIMPANDVVVTANYAPNTFHFAFNNNTATVGNRITGTMENSDTFTYGVEKNLPVMNGFIHDGYTFAGWALSASGEVVYDDGAVINTATVPESVKKHTGSDELTITLYAVWHAATYTVTFDATTNGGLFQGWECNAEDALTTKTVTYFGTYGASDGDHDWPIAPKKPYYHFIGWFETVAEGGTEITAVSIVNKTSDHKLYAHYAANTFTVVYEGNGKTGGSMANSDMTYGNLSNELRKNTYQKTGYLFGGWAISEANALNKTVAYTDGAEIGTDASIDGNTPIEIRDNNAQTITLYAIWNIQQYDLVFSCTTGGTASAKFDEQTQTATTTPVTYAVTYDSDVVLTAKNDEGYHFAGWNVVGATISDRLSAIGNTIKMPARTVSVQATFEPNTFYVKYMANNGTDGEQKMAYSYDYDYTYADNNSLGFAKTGYDFLGWANTNTATVPQYTASMPLKNLTTVKDGEVTVYAVWQAHTYNIAYRDQGGAVFSGDLADGSPMSHTYDTETALKAPTKAGYSFGGWFAESDCSGTALTTLSATGYTANITLYAKWSTESYTITYDANDTVGSTTAVLGAGGTTDYTVETANITLPTISRKGYTFKNWAVSGTDHNWNATYFAGAVNNGKAGMYGNVTLTAQWTANTYSVTVNTDGGSDVSAVVAQAFDGPAFSVESPVKIGYFFYGWRLEGSVDSETAVYGVSDTPDTAVDGSFVSAGDANMLYFANLSSIAGGAVTLTAQWNKNEYMIVYHLNNGYTVDNIETCGGWQWKDTTGERFSPAGGNSTILSAYENDESYFFLHTESETRFALGWSVEEGGTEVDFKMLAADGSPLVVTYADLAAKSGVIENARESGEQDLRIIDLYAVWSANYADLETAVGAFQDKFMRFKDDTDLVRNAFHKDAPAYAVLPAVVEEAYMASADPNTEMYNLYERARNGKKDARPGSPNMAYDVTYPDGCQDSADLIWLGYTWIVDGGVDTSIAQLDWQNNDANDFTKESIKQFNEDYLTIANELVVHPYTAYCSGTIRSEADSAVLDEKATNITVEDGLTPPEYPTLFAGLELKPIDVDHRYTKEERVELAKKYGNKDDYDCCVPLGGYTPNEAAYKYLIGDPFRVTFADAYPPCEGDTDGATHSMRSLITLCNRVISVYDPNNPDGEKLDELIDVAGIDFIDPETGEYWENNPHSEYTLTSVMYLYDVLYGTENYGEPQYNRIFDVDSGEVILKQPSQYVLEEVFYRVLEAYHRLEIKDADFTKFESLVEDYFAVTWVDALINTGVFDEITFANRATYFTGASVAKLDAFLNTWFMADGTVKDEMKLKGPEQLYIDGMLEEDENYAGRGNGYYEGVTGFYYAEGTLCDQLLDLIDELDPITANYAEVYRTIMTIPVMSEGFAYPDKPVDDDETLMNEWRNKYATPNAWANGMYDTNGLYKYYTKDSVDALKDYLTATAENPSAEYGYIDWNLNVFSQDLISESIVSNLITLIAGLTEKEYRFATVFNNDENAEILRIYENAEGRGWLFGETIDVESDPGSYEGYKFIGWTTGPNGSGMTFPTTDNLFSIEINDEVLKYVTGDETSIGGEIVPPNTLVVYAQWVEYSYGLNIFVNGGTVNVSYNGADPVAVTDTANNEWSGVFGDTLKIVGEPQKIGYTFSEWTFVPSENNQNYTWDADTGVYTFGEGEDKDILRAVWTANTYTITLDGTLYTSADADTGKAPTTSGDTSTEVTYEGVLPEIAVPTMTGYIFGGYYEGKTGTGMQYYTEKGKSVTGLYWTKTENITLYAKWTAVVYTLNYDLAMGKYAGDGYKKNGETYGIDDAFNIAYATRTGYTFLGWKASTTYGKNPIGGWPTDTFGNTTTVTAIATGDQYYGDVTLTAQWSVNRYYVAFVSDNVENTSVMPRLNVAYTDSFDLPLNKFEKVGHTFAGWATTEGGTITYMDCATGLTALTETNDAVVKLYAVWKVNYYTLTVQAQGHGTVNKNFTGKVPYGATVNLTAMPETGYHFVNWTEYLTGTEAETSFAMPAQNVTVCANFAANAYTLHYDLNGGKLEGKDYKADGDTYTIEEAFSVAYASRTAYQFNGWTVSKTSGTEFGGWDGLTFNTNTTTAVNTGKYGNVTLTANWTEREYTITYDLNKGIGSTTGALAGEGYKESGTKYTVTESFTVPYATRTGYQFNGWSASKTSGTEFDGWSGISFNTSAVTEINAGVYGDVTLTANWIPNTYTIAFNGNGHDGGSEMAEETFTFDEAKALPVNTYEKTGYRFDGWSFNDQTFANGEEVVSLAPSGTVTLYAKWTIESCKLIVATDENGASATATYTGQSTGVSIGNVNYLDTVTLYATANPGYHFKAWVSDQVTVNEDNTFTMPPTAVVVTATFEANTYTVTFNGTTATSGEMQAQSFTYGEEQALRKNEFVKTGYDFDGWSLSANGAKRYDNEEIVSNLTVAENDTVELFARWTKHAYALTVAVDSNDHGSATTEAGKTSTTVLYEETIYLVAQPDIGYHFDSWTTDVSGVVVTGNSFVMPASDMTVTAHFAANTYTVEFNKNGGNGAMDSQSFRYDESKALSENKFTRTGWTFIGWARENNATEATYENKAVVSELSSDNGATVTLYAVWEINQYTLTVATDTTKGTVTSTPESGSKVTYGADATNISAVANTGYHFVGWTVSTETGYARPTGFDTATFAPQSFKMPAGDVSLTANFAANEYTLRFIGSNATSGSMENQTVTYGTGTLIADNQFERTGYTFTGWNVGSTSGPLVENQANTDMVYADLTAPAHRASVTLYANWTLRTYDLTVVCGENGESATATFSGETTGVVNGSVRFNDTVTLAKTAKPGYHFDKWVSDQVTPDAADKFSMPAMDVTVTATFAPNTYTVSFEGKGGIGLMDSMQFFYGEPQKLTLNKFEKAGYDFAGWSKSETADKVDFENNEEVSNLTTDNDVTITLYAVWELHKYSLTINTIGKGTSTVAFGTTSGVSSASVPYTSTVTLTAVAATGYTFYAWSSNDVTINVETNSFVMPAKDVTITATFTPNTYTVTFMPNGGEGASYSQTFTYDEPQELLPVAFTKKDYKMVGWNTAENGSGTVYKNQESVTNLTDKGDIKLYAQWVLNEFKLNFNVSVGGGEFVEGNGFSAGSDEQSKMISFGESFGRQDDEGKTWPEDPVKLVTMAGQQVKAPFVGWRLADGTFISQTDTVSATDTFTVYAVFEDLTEVTEVVQTAVNINANHYTDEALQRLDEALKAVVDSGETDTAAKQALEEAIADLENHKLTTDGGKPKITVFENKEAVQAELANDNGYGSEVAALSESKGDISYVYPGKNNFTYYMYTNSANPFILVNTEDFGTSGRTSYPTTIEMDESGNGSTGEGQLRTRTGEILSGQNNYSVDTTDVGRAAGYSIGERQIADPYAELSYAGAEYGDKVGYNYYKQANYLALTPTFVERVGGAKQYALYTFTAEDDSLTPEKAQYVELTGALNTETLGQTDISASKSEAAEITTPQNTVTIFVEYLNNMPLDGSTNAGGQAATKDGVGTSASNQYLNVYTQFGEDSKTDYNSTTWVGVDYLYRTSCLSTADANINFIAPKFANENGKYDSYVANDPKFGQNDVGSFYYLMTKEDAANSGYWTIYDAQIASGATPAQARKAASDAALLVMNSKVAKDLSDKTLSSATVNTEQQAIRAKCGDYISWPYTSNTKFSTQFYASAKTREEALVYVHIYDRHGNEFTDVIQRNLQDLDAPVVGATAQGRVTINESGGAGIKEIKITQYTYGGSGATLEKLDGLLDVQGNTFTVSDLYSNGMANLSGVYSLYVVDRAGHQTTIDFRANPADNGSVTITVNDADRMKGAYSHAATQPIISESIDEDVTAALAQAPMTMMSIEEADMAEIKTNTLDDVMATAPEEEVEEQNEIYSFALNTVYTVNLFTPAGTDRHMKITTTEGGIVKTYINGVYAPVKSGYVTVPGGSNVQMRVATKVGYELLSLTLIHSDGTRAVLDGSYNVELTDDVTIKAVFVKTDSKLVVSVENGAINGRPQLSVSPYAQVTVAANEAPEGKQFAYWAQGGADGTPVSYDAEYTFIVTANINLTAVYTDSAVEKTAVIVMDGASDSHITVINGKYSMAFSGKITLPEGAEIEEFGMLLTNQSGESCTADNFVIGGTINGVSNVKLVGSSLTEQGQFKMNINNVASGATRTGRMYMIVKLADGSTQTVYSNTWTTLSTLAA